MRSNEKYKHILDTKPIINVDRSIFEGPRDEKVDVKKAKSRIYYDMFLNTQFKIPTAVVKWEAELNVSYNYFKESITLTKLCTKDSYLKAFQFKLQNKILNCRKNLYKWQIADSPTCVLCNADACDSDIHALVECEWFKTNLNALIREMSPNFDWLKNINPIDMIFGVKEYAKNTILLIIKKDLFNNRNNPQLFSAERIKRNIYIHISCERKYLQKSKFDEKWKEFEPLVVQSKHYVDNFIN